MEKNILHLDYKNHTQWFIQQRQKENHSLTHWQVGLTIFKTKLFNDTNA